METERMKPMSIATEGKRSSNNENEVSLRQRRSGGMMIVIVSAVFAIFFLLSYISNPLASTNESSEVNVVERPVDIKSLLHQTTERGLNTKSLIPIKKSESQTVKQSNIPFIVSYMKELRLRSRSKPSNGIVIDPFDAQTMDMNLFVSHIPPMHTLVLNKFPSFPHHAILTTNQFQSQSSVLTIEDLDAWYFSLNQIDGFGIYNSDPLAGSSQPHKHVQLIPRESLRESFVLNSDFLSYHIENVPQDDVSSELPLLLLPIEHEILRHEQWQPFNPLHSAPLIHHLESYPFSHSLLLLLSEDEWKSSQTTSIAHHSYSEYLLTAYHQLMESVQLATQETLQSRSNLVIDSSYNLLLTQRWMFIVPRSKGDYKGCVAVNGFGFYGLLLFSNESSLVHVSEKEGLLAVLEGVSVPFLH